VHSEITLVPCQRDYLLQTANGGPTTIQFLIFNEFEQRFSTSTKVNCYKEIRLSDIGSNQPGPDGDKFSIFNVGVSGTLTGMSRLRSVAGPNTDGYDGRTILALLSENWASGVCAAPAEMSGGMKSYPVQTELCTESFPGCTCMHPGTSTTAANVQFQGSRLQGDRITIPLP
jgi:hypothetical protein